MMSRTIAGWLRCFLDRRDREHPDGRALFEYRVTREELDELQRYLTKRFPSGSHDAAAFCLYAAEWWRRHGKGFRWGGLLESIQLAVPYTELYEPIERGMKYWHRELRIGRATSDADRQWRDFVGTLSREGGLPLQMLAGSGGSLRRFFGRLLNERFAAEQMTAEQAEAAGHLLPPAWRHPDIYDLAANLITRIWELRDLVKDSDTPAEELDRTHPGWANTLPVLVDNDVANALVRHLVQDAHEIVVSRRSLLSLSTQLVCSEGGLRFVRSVELPTKVAQPRLVAALGLGDASVPRRLRLSLNDGVAPVPLAIVTQWGTGTPFDVEPLASPPIRVDSVNEVRLVAETRDGVVGSSIVRGGEALEETPWIFTQKNTCDDAPWEFAGQGSVRLRAERALVAIPSSWTIEARGEGVAEEREMLALGEQERRLFLVSAASVSIRNPGDAGEEYEIVLSAAVDELWSYRFTGDPLDVANKTPIWKGNPSLIAESTAGLRKVIPAARLEWRPVGSTATWRTYSPECIGYVEVRYASGGRTRVRKRVRIVPPTTELRVVPRSDSAEGGLQLLGSDADEAHILVSPGFEVRREPAEMGFEWTVRTTGDAPATVELEVQWSGGRRVRASTFYPVAGVRFVDRAGRVLPPKATIALENLPGCCAEAVVPALERAPLLEARLEKATDLSRSFATESEFCRPLLAGQEDVRARVRRYHLDLAALSEDVRLRLASSAEMNANVRLKLSSSSGGSAILHVRRFPISLWADRENGIAVVLREKSETHISDLLGRMKMTCVPVTAPDKDPVPLERRDDDRWTLPSPGEEDTTWLVVGTNEGRSCVRPIIWAPATADGAPPADAPIVQTIEAAASLPWRQTREEALLQLAHRMAQDPQHPEWPFVVPYVRTLAQLPATTFDLLDAMAREPATCVYSLFACPKPLSFRELWSQFEDLSFSWAVVPIKDWIRGVRAWWATSTTQLATLSDELRVVATESLVSHFRVTSDQILGRMPGFRVVREQLEKLLFPATETGSQTLTGLVAHPVGRTALLGRREVALMDLMRAHADDRWPEMQATRVLTKHLSSVLPKPLADLRHFGRQLAHHHLSVASAPVLAALCTACEVYPRAEQVFAIRQLRAFDINWFQECYEATLPVAVGIALDEDAERYQ